ncbi:MAG TPA: hypothetical protein VF588_10465 [Pyrinomonadaceae bacterium]|jgi:hypothetical protein
MGGRNALKKNADGDSRPDEGAGTFDRSFKYAVIIYAVVEFLAVALLVYHKATR